MKSQHQMKIRVPNDIKEFIEFEAKENACSQTSEIVRAIRLAMRLKSMTGGNLGGATPVNQNNNTANGGGAFIIKQ